ncbi:hypothetical protein SVIOM74S_08615 [Streptomyces violarus]
MNPLHIRAGRQPMRPSSPDRIDRTDRTSSRQRHFHE